jgi:hypothetical protein
MTALIFTTLFNYVLFEQIWGVSLLLLLPLPTLVNGFFLKRMSYFFLETKLKMLG